MSVNLTKKWKVGYYEDNLTIWKEKSFFTEVATMLYCLYLKVNKIKCYTYSMIK